MSVWHYVAWGAAGYLAIGALSAIRLLWKLRQTRKEVMNFWSGNASYRGTQGLLYGMGMQAIKDQLDEFDAKPWYGKVWFFLREVISWPLTLLLWLGYHLFVAGRSG